jgi:2-isopropylmalate synthase
MISRLTGYPIPANKAVVGRNAFSHESGIHQDGVLKNPSTYEIMDPQSVGWEGEKIALGKHSGRAGIVSLLEETPGFDKEAVAKTLHLYEGFESKRGQVSKEQLIEIHEEAKRRIASGYEIDDYVVKTMGGRNEALVFMTNLGTEEQSQGEAVSDPFQKDIDGSVAAIIAAVADATGISYEVENAAHTNVGTGKSAIDRAAVEIRINGKTVTGQGLSTDTVKAAALAYLDACKRAEGLESPVDN